MEYAAESCNEQLIPMDSKGRFSENLPFLQCQRKGNEPKKQLF